MPENANDLRVVRDLAKQYVALAAQPIQAERRALWTRHLSRQRTRPLVLATYGMWNVWCRELFGDAQMRCQDAFWRGYERTLRLELFHDHIGDDFILEPWLTVGAVRKHHPDGLWGLREGRINANVEGGAWQFDPQLKEYGDLAKLVVPHHVVDEEATARNLARVREGLGDLLPINLDRGPLLRGFSADISTHFSRLRGLEQMMLDMTEAPDDLHRALAFMRDAILTAQDEAERAGDWSLTCHSNQAMTYCAELPAPQPNCFGRSRRELWAFCAAQEFTSISPRMHYDFLLQYQIPILAQFGLCAYGCCEDLTRKIDILRRIPNLRIIAVTPRADVAKSAAQIGLDYVMSWRPNPTDMVCCGFDEGVIRRILGAGFAATRGQHVHVHLKDIETVEGDTSRLARWVRLVRELGDRQA